MTRGVKWPRPSSPPPLCTGLYPLGPDSLQTASLSIALQGTWSPVACFTNCWVVLITNLWGSRTHLRNWWELLIHSLGNIHTHLPFYTQFLTAGLLGKFSAISFYFSFLFWAFLPFTASHHLHIRDRNKIGKNWSPELIILLYEALVSISWTPTFRTYSNTCGHAIKRNNIPQGCRGNKRPG